MSGRSSSFLVAATLALGAAAPAAASAGNGIRVGGSEGRLHPFVDLETRYDSNVFFAADGVSDVVLHVRPGLELSVPGSGVALDLSGNLDWVQYVGTDAKRPDGTIAASTTDLSKLYGQAALRLELNRRGALRLEIEDEFRRTQSSPTLLFSDLAISNLNALKVRVPWAPSGGALVLALSGGWTLETFEPYFDCPVADPLCDPDLLSDLGYNELRGGLDVRWRFLPRTSAVFEAVGFTRKPNDVDLSDEVSGIELRTGFTGLVTPHLGGTLKVGYGDTLGSAGEDFRTWLLTVEAEWLATADASLKAAYTHGLGVDPGVASAMALGAGGGPYASSRAALGGRLGLGSRFTLRGDLGWERRTYELATGAPAFDLIRVEPSLEVALARSTVATLGYAYTDRAWVGEEGPAPYAYSKNEAWLRLVFTY